MKKIIFIIAAIAIGAIIVALLGASVMTNAPLSLPTLPAIDIDEKPADTDASADMTPETPAAVAPVAENPSGEAVGTVVTEFIITGANYSFTPSALKVKKGDTVRITLKNSGGLHDFVIDEFGVATKRINGGEEDTVTFVADKTGTFEFYCSVGSHRQMGMKGTITVTE
ncbi:MAG: hypothetical protein A3J58_00940 [Candidatus Sungbacteria bacterium RIFCSPHIGHO2_02_FULL_52_23]|uniref:EfeO-type cupredoxin-like domain-containing protein n=1 Tax=Candidatus Sungbacteria bacterium RIFCSPHIGHO2_02_FULL_52_23 TaxID=1802274 RepID=A0A1G2KVN6_9BACT|nr:MAG: hypothetical protein A3J58_00940 [Candidatus Sungbacteria bacterium RIFCSPHIGHO2_02_FULL_52_23]